MSNNGGHQSDNSLKRKGAVMTPIEQFWGQLINPPGSVTEIGSRRRAQLSASLSIIFLIVVLLGVIASRNILDFTDPINVAQIAIALGLVLAYVISRTKYFFVGSLVLVISLAISGYGLVFLNPQPSVLTVVGSIYSTIPLALVIGSVLLPLSWLIALVLVKVFIILMTPSLLPVVSIQRAGTDAGIIFGFGAILVLTVIFRNALERYRLAELKEINIQLGEAVQELNANSEMLETRVVERTYDLERRNRQIEAAARVSRVASSILDTDELIRQVVDLIRQSFDLYYVGLFLVDERYEWAILRAGTGEAGQLMVARGHRIRVGEGMVGWCIANGKTRVASETREDTIRQATTELPFTRSEAALPLTSRERVIGAMTVQSDKPDAFDQEVLVILQSMVEQVAVALDNARLYTESQEAIKALRRSYSEMSRRAWADTLRSQPVLGYISDTKGVYSIQPDQRAVENPIKSEALKIPVKVREQVLGYIQAQKQEAGQEWTQDEVELLETLVDQLSVALENARLYEESHIKAEHERVLTEISGRVRSSTNIDVILQTAVQDLADALKAPKGSIRLVRPDVKIIDSGNKSIQPSRIPDNGGSSDG